MKSTKRSWGTVAAAVFAAGALAPMAQGQSTDGLINSLVKKGILTDKEAKDLKADAEKESKSKPPAFVLPWGKESKLVLGGFVQVNAEAGDVGSVFGVFPDNPKATAGHTPIHDRFFLRRARINVTGEFMEHFDFKVEGDFSNSDGITAGNGGSRTAFSGTDIFINWNRYPEFNIKAGQYKAPFGVEQTTSDTTLFIAERSQVTGAITPERQIGFQLWGKPLARVAPKQKDLVEYAVGVFNGNNRNITVNDDAWFMYVGRIAFTPFAGKLWDQDAKLKLGADGYYSRYAGGTRLGQTGNLKFNNILASGALSADADGSLSGFTVPGGFTGESRAWGVNVAFNLGPFDLIGEYLEESVKPKHIIGFKEFTANGYYAQGSYYFPGKKFQLVSRWESFNPGQAPNDNLDSLIGGLNYYIRGDHLKLMLNYVHTWSDFRRNNPGSGEDQFDMVLLRTQLMF